MAKCSSQRLASKLQAASFKLQVARKKLFLFGNVLFLILTLTACAKQNEKLCVETEPKLALASENSEEPEYKKAALINVELGLHYLSQDQVARAKHKLMYAVKLAPTAVEPHSALAYFFEKVGDYKEAEQEHKKALRLGSAKGALYNNYGAFLYRQNRYSEAKHVFIQALKDKKYAHTAEVNENAGLCALKLSDFKQAENYFNTAIRQDPTLQQARQFQRLQQVQRSQKDQQAQKNQQIRQDQRLRQLQLSQSPQTRQLEQAQSSHSLQSEAQKSEAKV